MPDERWNVVVILTDQQSATAMSCAGNRDLHTPNLDRLAADGARFTRAYCAQPLCTPSRASMWTGRTPTEVSVRTNGTRLDDHDIAQSLGRVLRAGGYDCGYAGKWHVPELDVPEYSGFRRVHPETEEGLADACGRFLTEDRDRPFLLVASLTEPHGICEWARGQTPPSGALADADWSEWPEPIANYPVPAYEAELPRIAQSATRQATPTIGWSASAWREYRWAYNRLCERADALVGEIVDHVRQSDAADRTVIIFTSDHGDQMGAHGWSQKWVLYEESVTVPLIIVEPAHGRPGETRDELVSTGLDLLPTITMAAGLPSPDAAHGRSLLSSNRAEPPRERLFAETMWQAPGLGDLTGRMVRDDRYKYTCYAWGRYREQLVDLETDPGELNNLAQIGRHQPRLRAMRELLREEAHRVGDDRFARFVPDPVAGPR